MTEDKSIRLIKTLREKLRTNEPELSRLVRILGLVIETRDGFAKSYASDRQLYPDFNFKQSERCLNLLTKTVYSWAFQLFDRCKPEEIGLTPENKRNLLDYLRREEKKYCEAYEASFAA